MSTSLVPVYTAAQSAALLAARTAGRVAGPVLRPFLRPIRTLIAWPVTSQLGARQNALVAERALADRRDEREEVELFLRQLSSETISA